MNRFTATLSLVLAATSGCAQPRTTTGVPQPQPGATTPVAAQVATLRLAIDSMAEQPRFRNAHWGILIVDPARGDTLYSRNAGKLFMPASNQKIVTGAAALALLGPDFTFRTDFAGSGPIVDGTLRGDLLVIGRGDPTISDAMQEGDAMRPLRAVADSLAARGVRRIAGSIVAHGNAFPDATLGFGWAWDDLDYPYSAAVDALLFNEGFTRIVVRGADRVGGAPTVETRPARRYPALRVTATTVDTTVATRLSARTETGPPSAIVATSGGTGSAAVPAVTPTRGVAPIPVIELSGTIRVRDSAVVRIAHRDAAGAYLAALGEALRERGIEIQGGAVGGAANRIDTLFNTRSAPLGAILPVFEKPSQNQIGEILLKTMGLERTGVGTADSGRAVVSRQLVEWGLSPMDFAVRDGSGLSRHNYITPAAVARILDAMRTSQHFQLFHDALPVAGVDGTIAARMRGTAAAGNAHAKTGFIDKARALSGYVRTADGTLLIFSFIANNWTTATREVEEVQDAITVRLAELRLR
jgi:serine-type D-Ala-D-Ala carboxypeptidase/endopeptidase (penicillin-binding protein 4)